jgi:hypothetical protein
VALDDTVSLVFAMSPVAIGPIATQQGHHARLHNFLTLPCDSDSAIFRTPATLLVLVQENVQVGQPSPVACYASAQASSPMAGTNEMLPIISAAQGR